MIILKDFNQYLFGYEGDTSSLRGILMNIEFLKVL